MSNDGIVRGGSRKQVQSGGADERTEQGTRHQDDRGDDRNPGGDRRDARNAVQRFGTRSARRPAGVDIKKHYELLQRVNEENGHDGVGYSKITMMDAGQNGLQLGLILISEEGLDAQNKKVVFCHIKIVDSNNLAATRTVELTGTGPRSVDVPYLPSDAVDVNSIWASKIIPVLQKVHGVDSECHSAGASVIPRELKPEEDNLDAYYAIYNVASEAISRTMGYQLADLDVLTIDALRAGSRENPNPDWVPGTRYQLTINYNPPATVSPSGLPVRNDIELTTSEQRPDPNDRSRTETSELCRVSGFVYFEPTEKRRQSFGEQVSYAMFRPIYCLTQVTSPLQQTLEAFLFALHTAFALADPHKWMYSFYNRRGPISRLRDVGAFGYDIPYLLGDDVIDGNKVDTTSSTFTQDKLLWILNTATHVNSFGFQIDIEEAGEFSWQTLFFKAAAEGDRECYDAIIDAANALTDERFGERFHVGDDIFDGVDNVVDNGYYYTAGEERRDIRDWTYLETVNYLGDKDRRDVAMAGEFERTFSDVGRDLNLRIEERTRCYSHLCGDSFRITGKSTRLNIMPDFMKALYDSIQCDGFNITDTNLLNDFGSSGRRSVDEVDRYGVNLGRNRGGLFSRGRADRSASRDRDDRVSGVARYTRRG